jgi:A/G-specific adenine glycosylase
MRAKNLAALRRKLLRWYAKNKRDLPWRKNADPYAIWIAETMLQQTQVKTVLPYYERFLEAYPALEALARASRWQILRLWSGLGYYRRAAHLRAAARRLVDDHGGKFPQNYDALRALPGIGDYTAGALLSMAFQKRYPAVDGNALRVLSRVFNLTSRAEVRAIAARLVPRSRPGAFNQALMELGATVCLSSEPRCAACPIKSECALFRRGAWAHRSSTKRKSFRDVTWPLAIVRRRGKILLHRRPAGGLLAGLWELPGLEAARKETARVALRRELKKRIDDLPPLTRIGELRHSITYRRIRAPVYFVDCHSRPTHAPANSDWRWAARSDLEWLPMSSLSKKALRLFELHEKNLS